MKQNLGELKPLGMNIYQDSHKRTILADQKTKKLYIVEKTDERKMNLLLQRYVIAVTALVLIGFLSNIWLLAAVCAVAICIIGEYLYRKKFIPSLVEVNGQIPEKEKRIDIYQKESSGKNIARGIGGLILPVLLVINDYMTITERGFDGINTIALIALSIAFTIYALYIAYISFKAANSKKGENK